jgi:uncharacterized protein YukE
LIEDPNLQHKVGNAGAAYTKTYHRWTAISTRLVDLYQQTINSTGNFF